MSRYEFHDEESSSGSVLGILVGALAGFAVGVYVADKMGGLGGIRDRLVRRGGAAVAGATDDGGRISAEEFEDFDDIEEDDLDELDTDLEGRVLEAFRNDPILAERAIDIGSIGEGIVELAGWVDTEEEAQHAVTVARGVPDVDTVVNRLVVGSEEERLADAARRLEEGDPALTDARWEGSIVGTGRRRQGRSDEPDRHADPRVDLAERWSNTDEALKNAADDTTGIAERRARSASRGGRAASDTAETQL
jgi:hypothetical protein